MPEIVNYGNLLWSTTLHRGYQERENLNLDPFLAAYLDTHLVRGGRHNSNNIEHILPSFTDCSTGYNTKQLQH